VDIITLYYIQGALGDENICAVLIYSSLFTIFICVTFIWALHIVIKQQFFLHLYDILVGVIFDDLERPLTQISKGHHYWTFNMTV